MGTSAMHIEVLYIKGFANVRAVIDVIRSVTPNATVQEIESRQSRTPRACGFLARQPFALMASTSSRALQFGRIWPELSHIRRDGCAKSGTRGTALVMIAGVVRTLRPAIDCVLTDRPQ